MSDDLTYAMRECAQLLPKDEERRVEVFTRWDGLDIPPGTFIRVVVELLHKPDPEVTPVLAESELIGV